MRHRQLEAVADMVVGFLSVEVVEGPPHNNFGGGGGVTESGRNSAMRVAIAILLDLLTYGLSWLATWLRRRGNKASSTSSAWPLPCATAHTVEKQRITVVLACLNESQTVAAAVRSALANGDDVEVIVADGGSTDATRAAATAAGARVLFGEYPSRAACLNAGAAAASGELLIFLHADSTLPAGYGQHVRDALRRPRVALAAFTLTLTPRLRGLWLVEMGANLRARRRGLPWGDQGLCLRREVFEALGGFRVQPLLEDVELVCAARAAGDVVILTPEVRSSSRRWADGGVLTNSLLNQLVLLGREVGVPVSRMAKWYYQHPTGVKQY